uniref:BED-type domain-containing protein n=1 Tax=Populus davidiana TaxID=266767 RepID=A0A6M2F0H4_9ROSI
MELCNISNPTRDGEEVQEARDREVEEQDFAFVPAAPIPDNEDGGRDSSRLNASGRNKRRRTSKVWQYFDEVTENGEIWAKCKSCSNSYRGESKRGTTNLRRHLEKYCAGKK